MTLSGIIKEPQDDLNKYGDKFVKRFLIEDSTTVVDRMMVSGTRKKKNGLSAKMNAQEFSDYSERNKNKLARKLQKP